MKIGINALYLIPGRVGGSEIYLRRLLSALSRIDRENEYIVFTNRENRGTFELGENFREHHCPVRALIRPTGSPGSSWFFPTAPAAIALIFSIPPALSLLFTAPALRW